MCVCVTKTCETRISFRGGSTVISPRSNSNARRSSRKSTYRPGSPNVSLTRRGSKRQRIGRQAGAALPAAPRCAQLFRARIVLVEIQVLFLVNLSVLVRVGIAELGQKPRLHHRFRLVEGAIVVLVELRELRRVIIAFACRGGRCRRARCCALHRARRRSRRRALRAGWQRQ